MTIDSGDFGALFEKALKEADVGNFPERKRQSKAKGKLRGLGIGSYLEVTAPPNKEMGGIRFEGGFEGGKQITFITGTLDYGQGHASPFAQVLASRLGVPFESIQLRQGDSDELVFGAGTGGSRSMMMSGAAIAQASDLVLKKGRALAAEELEAAEADIEFREGRFTVVGTDKSSLAAGAGGEEAPGARRLPRDGRDSIGLPQRLPRVRGRDRPGDRPGRRGALQLGERLRHDREPAHGRGPDPRRRDPGHGPVLHGEHALRRDRPAPHRLVHGLRDTALHRLPCADRVEEPSGRRRPPIRSA